MALPSHMQAGLNRKKTLNWPAGPIVAASGKQGWMVDGGWWSSIELHHTGEGEAREEEVREEEGREEVGDARRACLIAALMDLP